MTNFKHEHTKLYKAVTIIILLIGIICTSFAAGHHEVYWVALEHFGIFISVTVVVTFIYENFLRDNDRKIFLSDLRAALREELASDEGKKVLEKGRRTLDKKVQFIQPARKEVIELGEKLNSFTGYFSNSPSIAFKDHIKKLLQNGVNIICILSDPQSEIIKIYSEEVKNQPNSLTISEINDSIDKLKKLQKEFSDHTGKIKIFLYNGIVKFHMSGVDISEAWGKIYISNYLNGIKRADCPGLELYKDLNPEAFKQYLDSYKNIISNSKEI